MKTNTLKKGITYLRYYGIYSVENILFYGGKMVGRIVFPFFLFTGKVGNDETYYSECELKSRTRIFLEQLWYILKTGEVFKDYCAFGFDKKSKNDFKNYVPWLVFTNARNRKNKLPSTPTYDSYNYICMLRDKFVFEAFCKRVGINTPTNIGMINNGFFHIIKEQKLIRLNNIIHLEMDAFLKRNVSYGGGMKNNLMPLRIEKGVIYLNDTLIEIDDLINLICSDCWVVQERIKNQHDALSKFHPSSINTIRIITVKTDSKIDVLFSKLRIGVSGNYADNTSSGGVAVDIFNGKMTKWGFYRSGLGTKTDKHPDTMVVFENYEIPFWDEIIDSVKNAHRLFYGLHSIGWDVCLTDNGIMLIEGNDNWDTIAAQSFKGNKKEYLKYFKT
jgi:putative polysaccharide biosynthesis protein